MFVRWVVHVHSIKFPFHIVLGSTPPILAISGNLFLLFLDTPGFKIVKSINITIDGVPYFSVGECLGSVKYYSLDCCKDKSFFSNLYRQVVSARILASLGSVLFHYFSVTMLLYLSVAF